MIMNLSESKISNNERSHSKKTHLSSTTEAWANQGEMTADANVSIPEDFAVLDAKDWVDNGSRL